MDNDFPRNDNINHSDDYYQELTMYKEKLEQKGIPVIYSLKHFSIMLEIPYARLLDIVNFRNFNYKSYMMKKKSGGYREILVPTDQLKYIQRALYEHILSKTQLDSGCIGFRRHYSIKNNAMPHVSKDFVLKIDLFRFFDSISEQRVFGVFKYLGYCPNLAYYFARLTTVAPNLKYWHEILADKNLPICFPREIFSRLPQGAPTSPILSNIIATKLDIRLRKLSESLGISYTRYADDLTFSGDYDRIPSLNVINKIIEDEGFFINKNKVRTMYKGQNQLVTGLNVTNGVHVPKKYKQDIIRHLYFCKKNGVIKHLAYIEKSNKSSFKDWLLGRIFFVYSIEPELGYKLLSQFNEIDWIL